MKQRILPHGDVGRMAQEVGVSRSHLSEVLHGKHRASVALAKRIEAASNGTIKASALLGLEQAIDAA